MIAGAVSPAVGPSAGAALIASLGAPTSLAGADATTTATTAGEAGPFATALANADQTLTDAALTAAAQVSAEASTPALAGEPDLAATIDTDDELATIGTEPLATDAVATAQQTMADTAAMLAAMSAPLQPAPRLESAVDIDVDAVNGTESAPPGTASTASAEAVEARDRWARTETLPPQVADGTSATPAPRSAALSAMAEGSAPAPRPAAGGGKPGPVTKPPVQSLGTSTAPASDEPAADGSATPLLLPAAAPVVTVPVGRESSARGRGVGVGTAPRLTAPVAAAMQDGQTAARSAEAAAPITFNAGAVFSVAAPAAQTMSPSNQVNALSTHADAGFKAGFEAQLSAALHSSDFAPALGLQISTLTRNGIPEARLHLNPAELGPIAVQIELDGRNAQVVLAASHAETRQALEQALPQLASAMRDAGFTMAGGGVFQQPQNPAQQGQPAAARRGRGDDGDPADAAVPTLVTARVQRGVVDLYA